MRYSGWHLIGTAMMGTDPGRSVVDGFGRAHEVENLYVVDGSVFPTSGGVNPTSTIAAFAARAADQLIAERHNQRVAA
jgi:choline dehydrogenase-like flavoprotein